MQPLGACHTVMLLSFVILVSLIISFLCLPLSFLFNVATCHKIHRSRSRSSVSLFKIGYNLYCKIYIVSLQVKLQLNFLTSQISKQNYYYYYSKHTYINTTDLLLIEKLTSCKIVHKILCISVCNIMSQCKMSNSMNYAYFQH